MKNFKRKFATIFASAVLMLNPGSSKACVGARYYSMGNTGITTVDNAEAVYWNPARLSMLEDSNISFTKELPFVHESKQDRFRYDTVLSGAIPIGKSEQFGLGCQLMSSHVRYPYGSAISNGILISEGKAEELIEWVAIGAGVRLIKTDKTDLSIGTNWKYKEQAMIHEIHEIYESPGVYRKEKKDYVQYVGSGCYIDIKNILDSNISAGVGTLTQNLDSLRIGAHISADLSIGKFTVAGEAYEVLDSSEDQERRIGLEQILKLEKLGLPETELALRAGIASRGKNFFGEDGMNSFGIGFKRGAWSLDISYQQLIEEGEKVDNNLAFTLGLSL